MLVAIYAIYVLLTFIFRDQFQIDNAEMAKIQEICIFLIMVYVKAWFICTDGVSAANQDLNLIKSAIAYQNIDKRISEEVLTKMCYHVDYLNEENVAMAFFDSEVSFVEKRKMVQNLELPSRDDPIVPQTRKKNFDAVKHMNSFADKNLSDFVTEKTQNFFNRFRIHTDFLLDDPSDWASNQYSIEAQLLCRKLQMTLRSVASN